MEIEKKLYEMLQNEELAIKLGNCKTPEECYEATKGYITDITFEEFTESMKNIRSTLEEEQDGLLSEEDMNQVAGGNATIPVIIVIAAASAAI